MQRFNAAAEAARGVCARFFATIARRRPRALTALPFASRGPSGGSPATLRNDQARATRARIADPGADRAAARPDAARPLRTSCPGRKNDPLHGSAGRRKGRFERPRPQRDRQDERSRPSGVAHPGAAPNPRAPGRLRGTLVAGFILLCAFLQPAMAVDVLVSNFSQTSSVYSDLGPGIYAQRYTTGSSPAGYKLTEVVLTLRKAQIGGSRITPTVLVRKNSEVGDIVATLHGSEQLPAGGCASSPDCQPVTTVTYRIARGVSLDPSTTYALQVANSTYHGSGKLEPFVGETTSSDETGLSGWSIADNSRYRPNGGSWTDNTRNSPLRIELKGNVNPYIHIAADEPKATGKLDHITYTR